MEYELKAIRAFTITSILILVAAVVLLVLSYQRAHAAFVGPLWLVNATYPHFEVPKPSPTPPKIVYRTNTFVGWLERRFTIEPNQPRVVPDCSCTLVYRGTEIEGNHYRIHIDKLD